MSGSVAALRVGFRQQLVSGYRRGGQIPIVLAAVPQSVVLGWLIRDGGSEEAFARVLFGVALLAAWTATLLWMGWLVTGEAWMGTYELGLATGGPLPLAMIGKSLALAVTGIIGGIVSVVTVLVVVRDVPEVANPVAAAGAVGVALVAIAAASLLLGPLGALSPGARAFTNAAIPVGIVISGFLFPPKALPGWAEAVARFLPTSWAMDAIVRATQGGDMASYARDAAVAVVLSAVWLAAAFVCFAAVTRRLVRDGQLPR